MNPDLTSIDCDALIFDLDGTLWDTSETCAAAWNRVCIRHAIPFRAVTVADVRAVTGRPHAEAIRSVYRGLPEAQLELLIAQTQGEDNRAVATDGGALYASVRELVPRLARSWPLMIVSNCQAGYIEAFLNWSELTPHFADIECWGNTRRAKPDNLEAVIARNQLRRPLFVGDTQGDCDAAQANGCQFIHAAYGFGDASSADARIHAFSDLGGLSRRVQ